jgi:hypothetical protein|tara:strand:+ start:775 stop:1149 length:375 start_codon:yes stop_codon:yes gene_type:complete
MIKFLLGLIGKSDSGRSPIGSLALDIREAIKGKEMDPQRLIELQSEINKVEAQSRSVFVAGWRPFIGWVCGVAFAFHYIVMPLLIAYTDIKPVDFDTNSLFTVLMGMLGLGGLRTFEKIKDKTK